ncbi:preprotein translocase subunit SecG [Mycoplasmopsis verecunda]|uniref:Protein-export membrane protein SecG n=1 Tax=Mycoplasmopsis verecunda TaxID=171291 RepID=A0A1T4LLM0_9BACT|nr:preprotein translocase subunit SecG [Mycoplasmopsis verecunda]WPB54751.1 preprotein translocase subunit SecG [Mycoplasmopsis verecunda]SJZ55632.1 preprotein translocase subunit SecG [Mycoplasmopsis verecunda]
MATLLVVLLMVLGFLIIIVSFLMSPDSNGFSGALVGSGDLDLFKHSKERGIKKVLKYSMIVLGTLIIVVSIIVRILY